MNFRNDTVSATLKENFRDANSDKNKIFQIAHYSCATITAISVPIVGIPWLVGKISLDACYNLSLIKKAGVVISLVLAGFLLGWNYHVQDDKDFTIFEILGFEYFFKIFL